ncbi:hypothetical protein GOQ27_14665 [Clostridium sp. D2Q-11]|uniref:HlyD family secretion protein n=1 Tax=Anaeromonas frigoriresistens TaxID=2683708 RepID=A0A942UW68_9FIRM|nr:HlyD family efflux transporter periplasmic adaptor subunit [Anaeromonas frigoriresistens]MBS4539713.1 hypothetical protein [Anaeromonas frigoriresistens]
MSKEERKIRRKRKKRIRLGILIAIIACVLFAFFPSFYSSNSGTHLIEKERIEKTIESKTIVVKKESIYESKGEGNLKFHYEEGEKIGKGEKLVTHNSNSSNYDYNTQIEEVDKKIAKLKDDNKSNILFSDDIKKLQNEIDVLTKKISSKVKDDETEGLDDLREKLEEKIGKKNKMTQNEGFLAQRIEELEEKKNRLTKDMNNNNNTYYSKEPGIISYEFDNLEEVYSYKNVLTMEPKDINLDKQTPFNTKELTKIEFGQPVVKVINNFNWYILAKLPIEKANSLNKGDNIRVRVKEDGQDLKGNIINLKSDKKNTLVLIEFDSFLHKYYKERFLEVDLILKTYEGLKIPSKAIVEKDGLKGVYTKNVDTVIKFKPIKILYENEDFSIVDQGERGNIYIGEDKERYSTVTSYDEVIIDGNLINKYIEK